MKKVVTLAMLGALLCGTAQAVPVITGGVAEEGRAAIEHLQKDYNLKAVFTGEAGIYLSDVNVQILDPQGRVMVNNVTQGPMLLADLPAGRYTLQAVVDGHVRQQSFTVGSHGLKTLFVRFPVRDENGGDYLNQI